VTALDAVAVRLRREWPGAANAAIAFAAAGRERDWVNTGAAWMSAGDFVGKFELESFVERAAAERID
jgi:hypothetical protein